MASRTLLSLEQFEQLCDDGLHELDEGDLRTMTFPKRRHTRVQQRLNYLLARFLEKNPLGEVASGAGFLLSVEPATLRIPDVYFLKAERAKHSDPDEYVAGAPDLAVEIVSPNDTASQLMRKVRQYLAAGAQTVWVVYPETCELHVFEASGEMRVVRQDQVLDAPALLPGFSVPLSQLFD